MTRTKRELLNRKILEDLGVIDVDWKRQLIKRYTRNGQKIILTKPSNNVVCIRNHSMTFSNVVYAWHVGTIPKGFKMDFIDGKADNFDPKNLRIYIKGE